MFSCGKPTLHINREPKWAEAPPRNPSRSWMMVRSQKCQSSTLCWKQAAKGQNEFQLHLSSTCILASHASAAPFVRTSPFQGIEGSNQAVAPRADQSPASPGLTIKLLQGIVLICHAVFSSFFLFFHHSPWGSRKRRKLTCYVCRGLISGISFLFLPWSTQVWMRPSGLSVECTHPWHLML